MDLLGDHYCPDPMSDQHFQLVPQHSGFPLLYWQFGFLPCLGHFAQANVVGSVGSDFKRSKFS
jgi:hypothetical protein